MKKLAIQFFLFLFLSKAYASAGFSLITNDKGAPVYYGGNERVVKTAIGMLIEDSRLVCTHPFTQTGKITSSSVIVGIPAREPEFQKLLSKHGIDISGIHDKWEAFRIQSVTSGRKNYLFVIGSDPRGAAYGVLELSRLIGVSPWAWWADVTPGKKTKLTLPANYKNSQSPSVQYRGIFLNDEDWGLMPWATQTLAPQSSKGAIGPEAYEKIFGLLLRLRANTVWPAMHECTVPFYMVEGNRETAEKYGMVVGASHCEPMMSNAAGEWDVRGKGEYDYTKNKEQIISFWTERLKELYRSENLFTIGMRGKHDGMMQGVKTLEEHKNALAQIIADQRGLLEKYVATGTTKFPSVQDIPQVFIPYKEVLEVYDAGLEVPDDVTLVWCDDNYGYIRRLSDPQEQQRAGRAGVYYHISYWGRPHDYLWLASTSPALVYTEMKRAYEHGADKFWILNVGDIKPGEYLTEFFLDMAWDIRFCEQNGKEQSVFNHLDRWVEREFGGQHTDEITSILKEYYRLANFRKPEHTGWSRVEEPGNYPRRGVTPVADSEYNPGFNNELQNRILGYLSLEEQVRQLRASIPDSKKNAFFQLVEYPVRGASLMNQKWLNARLSHHYTEIDLREAKSYAEKSIQAYYEIERITGDYSRMENGKWDRMMDFRPRNLPVFEKPVFGKLDSLLEAGYQPANLPIQGKKEPILAQNAKQAINLPENRQIVEGLGHSFAAVKVQEGDSLSFVFDVKEAGDALIKIAAIPNHDVDGKGMKISLTVDGKELPPVDYSVKDRSETWKQNVLRGQAIVTFPYTFRQAGRIIITVKALTPYIILDQVMIDQSEGEKFYEFPVVGKGSAHLAD
ncbi:MAG: glycosyl hydrolase 115 family protein [Breznakibacter sp.]